MQPRLDYRKFANSGAIQAMYGLEAYIRKSSIEQPLIELVKAKASLMNGCAFCIDMHTKDARAHGETEQRLYALAAWEETPFFNERERAALEWTEALTFIADNRVPDEVFERVRKQFSESEMIDLTLAVAAINAWNRFAISFRAVPGEYQPQSSNQTASAQQERQPATA